MTRRSTKPHVPRTTKTRALDIYKEQFRVLYLVERLTLRQVLERFREMGVDATYEDWESRRRHWGFSKNESDVVPHASSSSHQDEAQKDERVPQSCTSTRSSADVTIPQDLGHSSQTESLQSHATSTELSPISLEFGLNDYDRPPLQPTPIRDLNAHMGSESFTHPNQVHGPFQRGSYAPQDPSFYLFWSIPYHHENAHHHQTDERRYDLFPLGSPVAMDQEIERTANPATPLSDSVVQDPPSIPVRSEQARSSIINDYHYAPNDSSYIP